MCHVALGCLTNTDATSAGCSPNMWSSPLTLLQDTACGIDRNGKDVKIANLQQTLLKCALGKLCLAQRHTWHRCHTRRLVASCLTDGDRGSQDFHRSARAAQRDEAALADALLCHLVGVKRAVCSALAKLGHRDHSQQFTYGTNCSSQTTDDHNQF